MKTDSTSEGKMFGVYLPISLHSAVMSRIGVDGKTRRALVTYLEACASQAKTPVA